MRDEYKEMIGALTGVARASEGGMYLQEKTAALLQQALAVSPEDIPAVNAFTEAARAEKNRLVPDCALCASPCGRTADYDLRDIMHAEPAVRELKEEILKALPGTKNGALAAEALFKLGETEPAEYYADVLQRLQDGKKNS